MTEPTRKEKVAYYVLGSAPPAECAEWVRRDVASTTWMLRRALYVVGGLLLGTWIAALIFGYRPGLILGTVIGGVIGCVIQFVFRADSLRRRELARHEKKWSKSTASL